MYIIYTYKDQKNKTLSDFEILIKHQSQYLQRQKAQEHNRPFGKIYRPVWHAILSWGHMPTQQDLPEEKDGDPGDEPLPSLLLAASRAPPDPEIA